MSTIVSGLRRLKRRERCEYLVKVLLARAGDHVVLFAGGYQLDLGALEYEVIGKRRRHQHSSFESLPKVI